MNLAAIAHLGQTCSIRGPLFATDSRDPRLSPHCPLVRLTQPSVP